MQVLYHSKTDQSQPKFVLPDGFDIFHTSNDWANKILFEKLLFSYVDKVREAVEAPDQKALVIMNNFSGQTTNGILEKLKEKGIVLVMVPANTTNQLRLLDVSVNKSVNDFLRDKFRTWYAIEKQLLAGVEATAVNVNLSMALT